MKVKRISGSGSVQSFSAAVPAEQFESVMDGRLNEYARDAKIDGFRKGKVPMTIIRRRFGNEVETAIASDFLQSAVEQALAEHDLVPLDVVPERMPKRAPGAPLDLQFTVHGVATFKVAPFDGLEIDVPVVDVTDADVDAEITEFSYMFGATEPAETDFGARSEDTVVAELFDRSDPANPKRIPVGGLATPKSFQRTWGEAADIEGIRAGEHREFQVSPLPGNCYDKPFTLGVLARAVHKREPASMEDLMKRLSAETEPDLRANVRTMLEHAMTSGSERLKVVRLIDKLVKANRLKLPDPYVDKVAAAYDAGQSSPIVPSEHQVSADQLARSSIVAELLLSKIADDHDIQVSREEIVRFVVQNVDPNQRNAEDVIRQRLADTEVVKMVAVRIRREKALGLAMKEAQLNETQISNDEMRRMMATIPPITLEARMPGSAAGPAAAASGAAS
jgi:trigger factor